MDTKSRQEILDDEFRSRSAWRAGSHLVDRGAHIQMHRQVWALWHTCWRSRTSWPNPPREMDARNVVPRLSTQATVLDSSDSDDEMPLLRGSTGPQDGSEQDALVGAVPLLEMFVMSDGSCVMPQRDHHAGCWSHSQRMPLHGRSRAVSVREREVWRHTTGSLHHKTRRLRASQPWVSVGPTVTCPAEGDASVSCGMTIPIQRHRQH